MAEIDLCLTFDNSSSMAASIAEGRLLVALLILFLFVMLRVLCSHQQQALCCYVGFAVLIALL